MAEFIEQIRGGLAAAPAGMIVERLSELLAAAVRATEVRLLLVDYRLATLLPVTDPGRPDPSDNKPGSPAWRCFDRQEVVDGGRSLFVPVSVRGELLGVLCLGPAEVLRGRESDLRAVGEVLAHALAAARLATDRYLIAARAKRLTLAAEMQWESLPGRCCAGDEFSLAGQLEPAYAVKGDTFDWSLDVDRLTVSVIDGMGEGVAAAALSLLAMSALRNARRGGLGIVDQAALADAAVFALHRGARYVSVLLAEIELSTGRMSVVDTGSPMLMLARGPDFTELGRDRHDPLGMFEGSRYVSTSFPLEPGDRLVIISDGIHSASSGGRPYREVDLFRVLRRSRGLRPLDVVRTLVGELRTFVDGELEDDAATLCLDWAGPSTPR